MDVYDISDRLTDLASELKVVIAAVDGLHPYQPESYGLYVMINRQIDQINAIRDEILPPPGQGQASRR